MTVYGQDGYAVRLEWGADGVRELASECGVLIIVDVLVFTTSVDIALDRGGRVRPVAWRNDGADRGPQRPSALVDLPPGTLLDMASPNGATLCADAAGSGAAVLAGCLRNASAVAGAARQLAGGAPIGVVPAGERWHHTEARGLRPSVEELLGAGAIVHALGGEGRSPEAEVAALAFLAARGRLRELLAGSVSGRELARAGVPVDVRLAGDLDASPVAPIMVDGVFEPWTLDG